MDSWSMTRADTPVADDLEERNSKDALLKVDGKLLIAKMVKIWLRRPRCSSVFLTLTSRLPR